jgi:hypothetical protein
VELDRVAAAADSRQQAGGQRGLELAILAPSLIAETATLWLVWHSHLLVRQMSAIMAAFRVFTWWLKWTVLSAAKRRISALRARHYPQSVDLKSA